ncbi:MAG TPA: UDP-N-acetylmuramate--L-alanine ligase [Bacteroidia bacterium]|nr:UDP-N-acetylmuramate--L-alanine ligase [Bacteroidia bacterium]HNU32327.1 UDP-N-acetylmuramate--L-alanine ligase [Bacteroidia bacterium]
MSIKNITHVYFIGLGGIGMSAIARYFIKSGKNVAGYDKTPTSLTDELIAEGMDIHFEDNINLIPPVFKSSIENLKSEILIVFTPAIPKHHTELNYFLQNGYSVMKRSQVLGLITAELKTVGVAGTHGKTTTSSIVAHLLKSANKNVTAFLGGIAKNYQSNFIMPSNFENEIAVVEADEFDRSFLTLHPSYAVITSMDADHLDIYQDKKHLEESYNLFANQVKHDGILIYKEGIPLQTNHPNKYSYSLKASSQYAGVDLRVENHQYVFNLKTPTSTYTNLTLGLPGRHNAENAVAACAIALNLGLTIEEIKTGLKTYAGVKRRFDLQFKSSYCIYIDDYAHHPEELKACILSVKEMYEGKKITGIFQPHLFTRTRDFADGFADSLSLLDEVILLEIYPARELPIEGVNSSMLLDKIKHNNKKLLSKEQTLEYIKGSNAEVLLTLGAGDIDTLVKPIRKILEKKNDSRN